MLGSARRVTTSNKQLNFLQHIMTVLPPPDEVAAEIVESLELALDRFRNVAKALGEGPV